MLLLYSIAYTLGFIALLPLFLLRREKYASGFRERLGNYSEFKHDSRKVIWLHCVSVGETNAARPLVDALIEQFPSYRVIVSTTTKTGQNLANKIFAGKADAVFYLPFDWKFSVRRALKNFRPSLILLMETEIWPRLIVEAKRSGAHVAIVNGRLSERSFRRYSTVGNFVRRVLQQIDLALMQTEMDAERIEQLGLDDSKTHVIGNLKFEISADPSDSGLVAELRRRFRIDGAKPLIIAASTHEPEEQWVLDSLDGELGHSVRLMIAPRHPERFDDVSDILERSPYTFARRSAEADDMDINADIILLDTIGELRGAYSLADIVFVGGSLIPHGGQSILEPAAAGKAIVTGPYTHNFDAVVNEFLDADAIMQTPPASQEFQIPERLNEAFIQLLENPHRRAELAANASAVMGRADRGAAAKTVEKLRQFLEADR